MDEFDYIVVGAGSAGCVIAARLTESGRHKVALIEAGGEDDSFWIRTPIGFGTLYENPKYNWLYHGEPEPELNGARSYQARGKVLGGTSSINGMVYIRGQREDFDHWRQLGNTGWSYDDVLPYFKKSENNQRGGSEYHGTGGPLSVSDLPRHELADAFVAAGAESGYERNDDINGAAQDGFGYVQHTTSKGRRSSTSAAFLRPARNRANLKVITDALATRILFDGRAATGIEIRKDGVAQTLKARREVVLAGGVFNSPQLLQLSGIGRASFLQEMGIPVVHDLQGVGENLQDHFTATINYRCTRPITVNDAVNNPLRRMAMGARYILLGTGPMASSGVYCAGCIRSDPALASPDIKINLQLWCRGMIGKANNGLGLLPFSAFGISMNLLYPESRGTVRIKSPNPNDAPQILFNFLSAEEDRYKAVLGLRAVRKVATAPSLTPYVADEIAPGPALATDEELLAFCRSNGRSTHHGTSTCKMGVDAMAVVDPRLKVHGVGRLRVIDASIMPTLVGGNTNAAAIMIGEKGAAMLLEDA